MTLQCSWRKLWNFIEEDDEGLTVNDFVTEIGNVPGCESVDEENVSEWFDVYGADPGYKLLNDVEIAECARGEVESSESASSEQEDEVASVTQKSCANSNPVQSINIYFK